MDKYINKDILIGYLQIYLSMCIPGERLGIYRAIEEIKTFRSDDVRKVVLCENCKHCLKEDEDEFWCKVNIPMHLVSPDDWCSRGEERDDG